jgi:hypothetical protein
MPSFEVSIKRQDFVPAYANHTVTSIADTHTVYIIGTGQIRINHALSNVLSHVKQMKAIDCKTKYPVRIAMDTSYKKNIVKIKTLKNH